MKITKRQLQKLIQEAIEKEIQESSDKDLKGTKCKKCKKGTYGERSIHDDMDGKLACDKCKHQVKRYESSIDEQVDGREELKKKDPFTLRAQLEKAAHNLATKIDADLDISEGLMMDDRTARGKYTALLVELGDALVEFHQKFNDIKSRWNEIR